MENEAIEGRLAALEYMVGQLLRQLPPEARDALKTEANTSFTGHAHLPEYDSQAAMAIRTAHTVAGYGELRSG